MVDSLMPWLSYFKPFVLRIDWNNEQLIRVATHPILFNAGMNDELVPHWHMERLHALATASRLRQWHPIHGGSHNDAWVRGGAAYFKVMRSFIETVSGASPVPDEQTCLKTNNFNHPPMKEQDQMKQQQQQHDDDHAIPNMLETSFFQHMKKRKDD